MTFHLQPNKKGWSPRDGRSFRVDDLSLAVLRCSTYKFHNVRSILEKNSKSGNAFVAETYYDAKLSTPYPHFSSLAQVVPGGMLKMCFPTPEMEPQATAEQLSCIILIRGTGTYSVVGDFPKRLFPSQPACLFISACPSSIVKFLS
jgi:hypothetical protein